MAFPSKFITYKDSIISKFPEVLEPLEECDYSIKELYRKVKSKIGSIETFLDVLDCLFMLGKIEYDEESEVIHYVKTN